MEVHYKEIKNFYIGCVLRFLFRYESTLGSKYTNHGFKRFPN